MKEGIEIISIENISELPQYEKDWDNLIFNSHGKNLYITFSYIYEWLIFFNVEKNAKILLAFKNGKLVGILPIIKDKKYYNFGQNVYKIVGEGLWGYTDILIHKDYECEVYDRFIDYIYDHLKFNRIEFGPLHEKSHNISFLINDKKYKYKKIEITKDAPNICTNISYKEHIKNKGNIKSITSDIDRCKRRLSEMGKIECFCINNISQIDELYTYLKIYFDVYNKQRNTTSRFVKNSRYYGFYTNLAVSALRKQYFELFICALDGKPIAFSYGFLIKGVRYYFTPTYDVDYLKYSPGKILLQHIIKDSFDHGYEFDFMNGIHPYNLEWSNNIQKRIYIYIFRNAPYYYYYRRQKYVLKLLSKIGRFLKKSY